jgi:hypothetical protein
METYSDNMKLPLSYNPSLPLLYQNKWKARIPDLGRKCSLGAPQSSDTHDIHEFGESRTGKTAANPLKFQGFFKIVAFSQFFA